MTSKSDFSIKIILWPLGVKISWLNTKVKKTKSWKRAARGPVGRRNVEPLNIDRQMIDKIKIIIKIKILLKLDIMKIIIIIVKFVKRHTRKATEALVEESIRRHKNNC